MPDGRDKLKKLHENLVRDGYALPDYMTFEKDMADSNNLKRLHGTLLKDGYELPDEVTFRNDMGYGEVKKKDWVSRIFDGGEKSTNGNGLSGGLLGKGAKPVSEEQRIKAALSGVSTSTGEQTVAPEVDYEEMMYDPSLFFVTFSTGTSCPFPSFF